MINKMQEIPQAVQEYAIPLLLKSNVQAETSIAKKLQEQMQETTENSKQTIIVKAEEIKNVATDNVLTYQAICHNKPWFVVIYDRYTSQASADFAINNLLGTFADMSTWIKSWQVVHNNLRLNNE